MRTGTVFFCEEFLKITKALAIALQRCESYTPLLPHKIQKTSPAGKLYNQMLQGIIAAYSIYSSAWGL